MDESKSLSYAVLIELAQRCGLEIAGTMPLELADSALRQRRTALATWQEDGFAGEMSYMQRDASLFVNLPHFLPSVRSVVGFVIAYGSADVKEVEVPHGYGRIARYAWGRDYHRVLKKRLTKLVAAVAREKPSLEWRSFSDAVPLLERALLSATGKGFIGNNSMFIVPGIGSFTFLAEILWNLDVVELPQMQLGKGGCGTCRRCLDECPTAAFASPRRLDARKCISYLTIEKKSMFTEWEANAIGTWLFGCDICQEVCPFNHSSTEGLAEFAADRGAGPYLNLRELLATRDSAVFEQRFGGTAIMRAGRRQMLRNAATVAANTRLFEAIPELIEGATTDSDEIVRASSLRALQQLFPDSDSRTRRKISNLLDKLPNV